ncbi:MAG: hypothetical protein ACXVPN_04035 [Bacteroidia bacterium]
MKTKLLIAALTFILLSCAGEKMELPKAKEVAEACLTAIDKGDYAKVKSEYYSDALATASADEIDAKFKKLKEVTGDMQSFELTESAVNNNAGEEPSVVLSYNVKHAKINTVEKFVIVLEGSKYKISLHDVRN